MPFFCTYNFAGKQRENCLYGKIIVFFFYNFSFAQNIVSLQR